MYPATLANLRTFTSAYNLLTARPDAELTQALTLAQGEIELACPAAYEGTLDTRLDRAAWGLHCEIATWHLRAAIERDMDTGSMPTSLNTLRSQLDTRLETLAKAAASGTGSLTLEAYPGLGDAGRPGTEEEMMWDPEALYTPDVVRQSGSLGPPVGL